MKPLLICVLLLATVCLQAQPLSDCSATYQREYKKLWFSFFKKEISEKTYDSVRAVLSSQARSCAFASELPDSLLLIARSGRRYTNDSLRGKFVLMTFWMLNCGPCLAEIPFLNKFNDAFKNRKDFAFITMLSENDEKLNKFLQVKRMTKMTIEFEVVPDSKAMMQKYFGFVNAVPTHILLNPEGRIIDYRMGAIMSDERENSFEAQLHEIMNDPENLSSPAQGQK